MLIVFRADTHHLIPIYAVGAFLSFTLAQSGMVLKWLREKGKGYPHKLLINAFGAIMNRSALLKTLNYANLLSSNVVALHIATDDEAGEQLREKWEETGIDVPLEIIKSPYRDLIGSIEEYISAKEANLAPGDTISVVMARFVEAHWHDNILHNQTAYSIIRRMMTHRNVATVSVPYIYSSKFEPADNESK